MPELEESGRQAGRQSSLQLSPASIVLFSLRLIKQRIFYSHPLNNTTHPLNGRTKPFSRESVERRRDWVCLEIQRVVKKYRESVFSSFVGTHADFLHPGERIPSVEPHGESLTLAIFWLQPKTRSSEKKVSRNLEFSNVLFSCGCLHLSECVMRLGLEQWGIQCVSLF